MAIFILMKPVMHYTDFRLFLQDFYAERKPYGFSYREFSRLAGYSSPVFMKLVMEGKANLSEAGTERVAHATGLIGKDVEYFRALVAMNQSKDASQKKAKFKVLREIAKSNKIKIVGEEQYDYYESWLSPVLREALPQMPSAKIPEIADKLTFKKSSTEIRKAIHILTEAGFLTQKDNRFTQTDRQISTGNLEIPSLAVRDMHRQMGELAVQSLDAVPVQERDISGLTLGIPESALTRIRNEIADFRRRITNIATESATTDRVYRLNIQFFPLTHKLSTAEEGSP